LGANAFAILAAKHASRNGQQNLLFHDLVNVERLAVKYCNRHFGFGQFGYRTRFILRTGYVFEFEVCIDRQLDQLQTSITLDLGSCIDVSVDKDLISGQPDFPVYCRRRG
jgi:hypothetical protein